MAVIWEKGECTIRYNTIAILCVSFCREFQFENFLLLVGLGLFIILMISMCWSYCADSEKEAEHFKIESNRKVIAQEVRPGLIIVRNCDSAEDTMRVIQEYDAMMEDGRTMQGFPQCGGIFQSAHTRAMYVQQRGYPFPPGHAQNIPDGANCGSLIDMDMEEVCRPPPYAPIPVANGNNIAPVPSSSTMGTAPNLTVTDQMQRS